MKIKQAFKKLSALCLALVMVLGISVPTVANAEEGSNVIDVVEVNGVQEAAVGVAVTSETFTIPEGVNYSFNSYDNGWSVEYEPGYYSWVDNGTVLETGKKYMAKVNIVPNEGYVLTEETVMKINGEVVDAYINLDTETPYIVWSEFYAFYEQVDEIEITNLPTAEIGGKATVEGITIPDGANYEIGDISWYNYTKDEYLEEGDVFEKGYTYNLGITINVASGYEFTEDTVVIVDGDTLINEGYYVSEQYADIWKEYSFAEKINKIEIINAPIAEVGKEATTEGITVPDGANYVIEYDYTKWYNDTTGEEATAFEDGNRYSLCIAISAKEGYGFAEDAVVLVNGEEVYEEVYLHRDWGEMYCEYSFMEQIDKIEILNELPDAKAGETAEAGELQVAEGAKYSASYAWMHNDLNGVFTGEFETGEAYVLAVAVQPVEGCEFTEDVVATIAGKPVDSIFVTNNGASYVIMETHDLGENTIDKIEISATEPKAGKKISADDVKVPEDAKYEILYAAWCDAKTGKELTTGTFEEGKKYQLMVVVQTEEGVYLSNDVKIMLNGKEFAGAKFDNNTLAMPFLAVCELGFDLTVVDNNQNNNNTNNTQNNNQSATVTPSPATGDQTNMILWIAIAVIAVTGMAVVILKKRYEV